MIETIASSETSIRTDLATWLEAKNWSYRDLRFWIKGYRFLSIDADPFVLILRSIHASKELSNAMSCRIAQFLEVEKPYQMSRRTDDDDEVLFVNLFYLAAGLNNRKELGEQLIKIFRYFEVNSEEREEFFSMKKWPHMVSAFREALICNQIDQTLGEIWTAGICDRQISYLAGDVFSYFRGIVYLPSSTDSDMPDIETIGWALARMDDYLEARPERGRKFRGLIRRTKEVWIDYPCWNETFHILHRKYEYRNWALSKLDSLVQPLDKHSEGLQHYLVWELYLPFLRELRIPYTIVKSYGIIHEIRVSEVAKTFLDKTSEIVESIRLNCPFESYDSIVKASNQGFLELYDYFVRENNLMFANAIERGRIEILNLLGMKINTPTKLSTQNTGLDLLETWLELLIDLLKNFIPQHSQFIATSKT